MTEAVIANVALVIRAVLLGGFLLLLPRITRRGLLFGVYVGDVSTDPAGVERLQNAWRRGCFAVVAGAVGTGLAISAAGWPVAGDLIGTAVLLLGALALYLTVHAAARRLAAVESPADSDRVTAGLDGRRTRAELIALAATAACLAVSLATGLYAVIGYRAMPAMVPAYGGLVTGAGEALVAKSLLAVLFAPMLNLILTPFLGLLAVLTATAPRSLRNGTGELGIAAQTDFRSAYAHAMSGAAILVCAWLGLISVQVVRFGLSETASLGIGVWLLAGATVVALLGALVWIVSRYGQGGARLERTVGAPRIGGGLADNSRWVGGLFYVDHDDPAIMVEKRFGLGYTLNYGNRTAVAIVATFAALMLILAAVTLIATLG